MGKNNRRSKKVIKPRAEKAAEQASSASSGPSHRTQTNGARVLTTPNVALIFAVIGPATYFTGLMNPFVGDDTRQITGNPIVQSLHNLPSFFQGSTFYSGSTSAPLVGAYYRPLMMVTYSVIYALFGPTAFWFHLMQLGLFIVGVTLLFMLMRRWLSPLLAFLISLIFLVHPVNSESVYAIASLQEPLFLDFGLLALVLLTRLRSYKGLAWAVVALFLSLLSKESGILFVGIAAAYLFWFDRKRLRAFILMMVAPLVLYLALKIRATGLSQNPHLAAIDELGLGQRLMTAPSIMLFYLADFFFPVNLQTYYFWTYPNFSWLHVGLPLLIDVGAVAIIVTTALLVRRRAPEFLKLFLFFALWFAAGLAIHLQVVPLDATAIDTWFYFPMIGLLGMVGVAAKGAWGNKPVHRGIFGAIILVVVLLAFRTAIRGLDWKNESVLSPQASAGQQDYGSDVRIARALIDKRQYVEAQKRAEHAVAVRPNGLTYAVLGETEAGQGLYKQAAAHYDVALKFSQSAFIYEDYGALYTGGYGSDQDGEKFTTRALQVYPEDAKLWMLQAIFQYRQHEIAAARMSISKAYNYSKEPQITSYYQAIMGQQ